MEKTLEFAIQEALESGRQSAMPAFLEMEMREKIAQEIEQLYCQNTTCYGVNGEHCGYIREAVDVVRGKNV